MQKVKYVAIVFLISALFANCYKEVPLNNKQYQIKPVVNCLFSVDSVWKVNVSLSTTPNNSTVVYIDGAIVTLSSGNGSEEQLVYTNKGDYVSPSGRKPLAGTVYSLQVIVPGYQKITASDRIPTGVRISRTTFDTNLVTITPAVFSDPVKTYPVTVSITDTEATFKYYLLRPLYYDKEELKIFKLTQSAIDTVRRLRRITSADSTKLTGLLNTEYYGAMAFKNALNTQVAYLGFNAIVLKYSYTAPFYTYFPALFLNQRAYVNDVNFRHLADDYYSVFGEKRADIALNDYTLGMSYNFNPGEGSIFVNNELVKKEVEWYLEVNTLSESAYKYYTTYLQNIANRNHPFAEQANVFSNIDNGLGIFAGVVRNRVRVY